MVKAKSLRAPRPPPPVSPSAFFGLCLPAAQRHKERCQVLHKQRWRGQRGRAKRRELATRAGHKCCSCWGLRAPGGVHALRKLQPGSDRGSCGVRYGRHSSPPLLGCTGCTPSRPCRTLRSPCCSSFAKSAASRSNDSAGRDRAAAASTAPPLMTLPLLLLQLLQLILPPQTMVLLVPRL